MIGPFNQLHKGNDFQLIQQPLVCYELIPSQIKFYRAATEEAAPQTIYRSLCAVYLKAGGLNLIHQTELQILSNAIVCITHNQLKKKRKSLTAPFPSAHF